jgi:RHS repeat-associated protein
MKHRTNKYSFDITYYEDPAGAVHRWEYNGLGHKIKYTDATGAVYRWERDLAGTLQLYDPPGPKVYEQSYTKAGRIKRRRTAPGGRETRYRWDGAGRLEKIIDPLGRVTRYRYNDRGQLEELVKPGGISVEYRYDERGFLRKAFGPKDRQFTWQRDGSGLLTEKSDPEGTTVYERDGAGRVTQVTDIAGRSTAYDYKAGELVSRVEYPGETVRFTYDAAGRMTEAADPDMTERFSYNGAGRLKEVHYVDADKRVRYSYTARGRVRQVVNPAGKVLQYERDAAGRTTHFQGPHGVSAQFDYDRRGRPVAAQYGNGTNASWQWGPAGLRQGYRWQGSGTELSDRSYSYDKLGRLTERREGRYRWRFAYDAAGRLKKVEYPEQLIENIRGWQDAQFPPGHAPGYNDIYSPGVPVSSKPGGMPPGRGPKNGGEAWDDQTVFPEIVGTERWYYDDAANITGRRRDGQRENFRYTGLNRLVQAGPVTYDYNRAGEVTERQGPAGSADYEWNGRGELVEAELADGSTVSYGYDAFGRLVRRVKTPADGEVPPVAEKSLYIWHEREILAEYDEGERGELELYKEYFRAAGRLVAVKMHGFHGRREPGPEGFLHSKGGLMYYHTDRLGAPVAITDRHGEPVVRYAWDAYGRAMAGVFEPYNTVGFSGKMRDGATGLTYFGARWYDAESGKFLSRDPIRDGWNWHAYVGGDPVNYVDPWGLMKSEGNKDIADIAKSWAEKERGERLTSEEADFQRAIGIGEMVLGGTGIFSGSAPITGAFVMADGSHIVSMANNNKKANPGDLYVDLANPTLKAKNDSNNIS